MSDYLTAEQYEYARKTGDWESGKVLTHGQALNSNQQIVLEWLKEEKEERCSFESAIYWYFEDDVEPDIISDRLTKREFLQVLAAFAEWELEQEEE